MTRILDAADPDAIDAAAGVLDSGGIVVIPTDTVYGVAAAASRRSAVDRIFEVKRRSRAGPIAVLVSSLDEARSLAVFSEEAEGRAGAWPGALTLVLPRLEGLDWDLGGDGDTIGLRVPDHEVPLGLIRRCGPLAATSANLAGEEVPATVQETAEVLGEGIDLYLDGGLLEGRPSQVVSLIDEERILRE